MRTIDAPCKNCKDRKITENYNCHSEENCKKFKEYKERRRATKNEAETAMALVDVEMRRADRVIKRKTGKGVGRR